MIKIGMNWIDQWTFFIKIVLKKHECRIYKMLTLYEIIKVKFKNKLTLINEKKIVDLNFSTSTGLVVYWYVFFFST
jgi:hypothetical protein